MAQGNIVFSPISHSHPIAQYIPEVVTDCNFWLNQDIPFLEFCDECVIIKVSGWAQSMGIQRERREAKRLGMPILKLTQDEVLEWERKKRGY
jgi:hypothetical protein